MNINIAEAPVVATFDELVAAVEWLGLEEKGNSYALQNAREKGSHDLWVKIGPNGIVEEGRSHGLYDSLDEAASRAWRQILKHCRKREDVLWWVWKPRIISKIWDAESAAMFDELQETFCGGYSVSCAFNPPAS